MNRRPPWPLSAPSGADLSFDVWDHRFLLNGCQGVTVHHSDKAPTSVLDLGCGSGYWTIEAAKQWPNSIVTGFDMLRIQPDLHNMQAHKNLAHRVKWVHGNFFDGLPFLPEHFDFVHISWIGLGVPENEWQRLLEEVARVMKPGAIIELIEEDPIFPCCRPPHRTRSSSSSLPSSSSRNTPLPGYKSNENLPSRPLKPAYGQKTIDSIARRFRLGPYRRTTLSNPSLSQVNGSTESFLPFSLDETNSEPPHSQTHSRLKLAWETLLLNRFLPTNLLSVLPFYLSTSFVRIQTHPQLNIPLPPTSGHALPLIKTDSTLPPEDKTAIPADVRITPDSIFHLSALSSSSDREWKVPKATAPSSNAMHLARSVNTIKRCKDAIWHEYAVLFAANKLPDLGSVSSDTAQYPKDIFELDWNNWLNDMDDRMAMRTSLGSQLSWPEPPGDKPEWKAWRENLENQFVPVSETNTTLDLCRSIRAFVAWKA